MLDAAISAKTFVPIVVGLAIGVGVASWIKRWEIGRREGPMPRGAESQRTDEERLTGLFRHRGPVFHHRADRRGNGLRRLDRRQRRHRCGLGVAVGPPLIGPAELKRAQLARPFPAPAHSLPASAG
jgi:hypothetical protein